MKFKTALILLVMIGVIMACFTPSDRMRKRLLEKLYGAGAAALFSSFSFGTQFGYIDNTAYDYGLAYPGQPRLTRLTDGKYLHVWQGIPTTIVKEGPYKAEILTWDGTDFAASTSLEFSGVGGVGELQLARLSDTLVMMYYEDELTNYRVEVGILNCSGAAPVMLDTKVPTNLAGGVSTLDNAFSYVLQSPGSAVLDGGIGAIGVAASTGGGASDRMAFWVLFGKENAGALELSQHEVAPNQYVASTTKDGRAVALPRSGNTFAYAFYHNSSSVKYTEFFVLERDPDTGTVTSLGSVDVANMELRQAAKIDDGVYWLYGYNPSTTDYRTLIVTVDVAGVPTVTVDGTIQAEMGIAAGGTLEYVGSMGLGSGQFIVYALETGNSLILYNYKDGAITETSRIEAANEPLWNGGKIYWGDFVENNTLYAVHRISDSLSGITRLPLD